MNKGFTLIEMLIVLLIISFSSLININLFKYNNHKYEYQLFLSNYGLTQNLAMINKGIEYFDDPNLYSLEDIYFNGKGNVNMSQSIDYFDKEYIIILGAGRIYEKDE